MSAVEKTGLAALVAGMGPKERLYLSLGGGAARGMSGNMAAVDLLYENGVFDRVNEVWGCSAGSIVGGTLCSGTPRDEMRKVLFETDFLSLLSWFSFSTMQRMVAKGKMDGLCDGEDSEKLVIGHLRGIHFADCKPAFYALACHESELYPQVFGPHTPNVLLKDALRASFGMQGYFTPKRIRFGEEERGFTDGGQVEQTPLLAILATHKEEIGKRPITILAVHHGYPGTNTSEMNVLNRMGLYFEHLIHAQFRHHLRLAEQIPGVRVVLLLPKLYHMMTFGFEKGAIEKGYKQARPTLAEQMKSVSAVPVPRDTPRLPMEYVERFLERSE